MKIERKKRLAGIRIHHNKTLFWSIIGLIILLIALLIFTSRIKDNIPALNSSIETCNSDSDCIPSSCCHSSSCTNRQNSSSCNNLVCSQECAPGSLDCGQGSCKCLNNKCEAVLG